MLYATEKAGFTSREAEPENESSRTTEYANSVLRARHPSQQGSEQFPREVQAIDPKNRSRQAKSDIVIEFTRTCRLMTPPLDKLRFT